MPRVTVIIPTYNRARLIGKAIESVFNQTYSDFEIIIVDDGSTDETASEVAQYGSRIRYLYQKHAGSSEARNLALRASTGELIAFLDSDDVWYPKKLEKQIGLFDRDPSVGLVYSFTQMIDEKGNALELETRKCLQWHREAFQRGYSYETISKFCVLWPSTVVIRKSCLERTGFFDPRTESFEDWDLYLRLALEGVHFAGIPEPLVWFRIHRQHRTSLEFSQGRVNAALKHLALLRERNDLAFRDRARRNLFLQLAAAYHVLSDFPRCLHHIREALKLDPWLLFDFQTAKQFLSAAFLAPLLSKRRQAKGQQIESVTVKV